MADLKTEWRELEQLRREVADMVEHATPGGLWHRFMSWCLRCIERDQKDIIDEIHNR